MSIIGDIKASADVLLQANKIPEYTKLLEAMGQIASLQEELSDAREEARKARGEADALKDNIAIIATLKRQGDFLRDDGGHTYCIRCATVDKKLGPVVKGRTSTGSPRMECSECKQTFFGIIGRGA